MPILLATKITLLDILIATMVLKVLFFIFIFYVARLIKREDDLRDATIAPALLRAAAADQARRRSSPAPSAAASARRPSARRRSPRRPSTN